MRSSSKTFPPAPSSADVNDAEFVVPETFKKDEMNKSAKKTFGELYEQTLKRENEIRTLGYKLVVMWESDWLRLNRCVRKLQQKFKTNK